MVKKNIRVNIDDSANRILYLTANETDKLFLDRVCQLLIKTLCENVLFKNLILSVLNKRGNITIQVYSNSNQGTFWRDSNNYIQASSVEPREVLMSIIFELCNADNDPLNALQHLDYDSPEAYATAVELEEHYTLLHAEKIKASIDGTTFKPEEIDFKQLKSEPYASNKGLSHFDFYQMSWIVAYHTSHWFWICRRLPYEDLFQPFMATQAAYEQGSLVVESSDEQLLKLTSLKEELSKRKETHIKLETKLISQTKEISQLLILRIRQLKALNSDKVLDEITKL